jgi:hypothetical protein
MNTATIKRCKYKYDQERGYYFVYTPSGVKIPYQVYSVARSDMEKPRLLTVEVCCLVMNGHITIEEEERVFVDMEKIPCIEWVSFVPNDPEKDQDVIYFKVECDAE